MKRSKYIFLELRQKQIKEEEQEIKRIEKLKILNYGF